MKAVKVLQFRFLLGIAALFLPLVVAATNWSVTVGGGKFTPNDLTIQVGDFVHWTGDFGSHDVTADDDSFSSGIPSGSSNFIQNFGSEGVIYYYCSVHSSPGKDIASNENGRITVQSGPLNNADLALQRVDARNGSYAPGDSIPISISIKNLGTEESVSAIVDYYASIDSTINTSDTRIGGYSGGGLPAGQTRNFGSNAVFPNSIADGSYFIGAIIHLIDTNSANNTGVDDTAITVTSPAAAELVLFEVHGPFGSLPQGNLMPILARVSNTGTAASGSFTVQYYASTDSSISTQDRLIGTEGRGSVPAGETNPSRPINVRIPRDLAPGTYFIGAIVDFNDSNSADNINVAPNTITVTDSDVFEINIGLNDTWRSTDTRGQGFFITVFPDISHGRGRLPVMFVGWFTYDVERPAQGVTAVLGEPGHRWLTAYGEYLGGFALLAIELTQGGVFDSGVPAPTQGPYGTMKIWFNSCSEGLIDYDMPSVPVSGRIIITRVANDRVALCEELADP